mmetsp:Transcript_59789/g.129600  ORF Transcript_59789/g.129600 Transcript_59789/m.129600 type:complete len:259 (-) Transcript_59789:1790-2566(-)
MLHLLPARFISLTQRDLRAHHRGRHASGLHPLSRTFAFSSAEGTGQRAAIQSYPQTVVIKSHHTAAEHVRFDADCFTCTPFEPVHARRGVAMVSRLIPATRACPGSCGSLDPMSASASDGGLPSRISTSHRCFSLSSHCRRSLSDLKGGPPPLSAPCVAPPVNLAVCSDELESVCAAAPPGLRLRTTGFCWWYDGWAGSSVETVAHGGLPSSWANFCPTPSPLAPTVRRPPSSSACGGRRGADGGHGAIAASPCAPSE